MLDRRPDRARWRGCSLCIRELGVHFIELPHLAVRAPTQIPVPGLSQIEFGKLLQPASTVKSGSALIGDRFVVNKAVGSSGTDSPLIEPPGIGLAAFDPRDLRADQSGTIFKVLRAVLRPYFELPLVGCQSLEMLLSLVGSCGVPGCRAGERTVEMKLCRFEL